MAQPRFGTDGIRGRAPEDLTAAIAHSVGRASAQVLQSRTAVLGRDTRASGPVLSEAVAAGLVECGVDVIDVGVLPTPGVAFLSASLNCPGFVISASHNPYFDNGIKVIGVGGTKLSVDQEQAIEALLDEPAVSAAPTPGSFSARPELSALYINHVVGAVAQDALRGLTIVLDCANGASSTTAAEIFRRLGGEIIVLADAPNGTNINDGVGSTHPEMLAAAVIEHQADFGLAFDGDADRLVSVDETGTIVPGDALLALFAADLKKRELLANNAIVVTVMTNLGFHRAMETAGIMVETVAVGDRNVVEAIDQGGHVLGGEQSGHIIFRSLATTGDGVLTGVLLAELVQRQRRPLSVLSREAMTLVPQYLEAVRIAPGRTIDENPVLREHLSALEEQLGRRGRILVRASGTEPVIRVMVEADTDAEARQITQELVSLVQSTMGSQEEQ